MSNAPKGMAAIDSGVEDDIQWATVRAPIYGAVNGYVRIPEGHPWHGLDYDDIDVQVHGGLTFGEEDGWIGFDTLHSFDRWPASPVFGGPSEHGILWTEEMVAEEARRLARAVKAAS